MPPSGPRSCGEILIHVEKRSARDVARQIELAPLARRSKLPAAVHELVAHSAKLLGAD
jgi:hypothetical protein